jgi:hypothetical protein
MEPPQYEVHVVRLEAHTANECDRRIDKVPGSSESWCAVQTGRDVTGERVLQLASSIHLDASRLSTLLMVKMGAVVVAGAKVDTVVVVLCLLFAAFMHVPFYSFVLALRYP